MMNERSLRTVERLEFGEELVDEMRGIGDGAGLDHGTITASNRLWNLTAVHRQFFQTHQMGHCS